MGKKMFLFFICVFSFFSARGQEYYYDIPEKQYYKIVSGNNFYEGQIQLIDNSWHKGWVARFPDSNIFRFRSIDDSIKVWTMDNEFVKSIIYNLNDTFPHYTYKKIPLTDKKTELKLVEVITMGKLNLYLHKWVEKYEKTNFAFSKSHYKIEMQFYVEKNLVMYRMDEFESELVNLIKDNKELYKKYKDSKAQRKNVDYVPYITIINNYNE